MRFSEGAIKYLSNTSWLVVEKIFGMVISFLVGIYVVRYLGPEKFGVLSYSQSFVGLFVPIVNLGIDSIVIREMIKNESKIEVLLGTSLIIKSIGCFLAWMIIGLILIFNYEYDVIANQLIVIIAIGLFFQNLNVIDFYFQAKVASKYSVKVRMSTTILFSSVKLVLVANSVSLVWFAVMISMNNIVVGLLFLVAYQIANKSVLKWRFSMTVAKSILKDCWPLLFSGLLVVLYLRIDQVMLKNMTSSYEVGIYAVAVRISELWYFIPVLITQSVFPAIINSRELSIALYRKRMQKLYDLMTLLSLLIGIIITIGSKYIVEVLFGNAYAGADVVIVIHIWSGVAVFYGVAQAKWIIAENMQRKTIFIQSSGAVINIAFNLLFIPRWGAKGAALATLLSYTLNTLIVSIIIKELRGSLLMFLLSFKNLFTLKTFKLNLTENQ